MILSDRTLKGYGEELVSPFVEENVQPASIDLRLGRTFRVFDLESASLIDLRRPETYQSITKEKFIGDAGVANPEFILHPGEFVLSSTEERVCLPSNMVGRVEGKSSLGRLGLIVHATAGFIDPGFEGNVTLEMTNLLRIPIALHPGMLVCQISFTWMDAHADNPYRGRYQGAEGVEGSKYGIDPKGTK